MEAYRTQGDYVLEITPEISEEQMLMVEFFGNKVRGFLIRPLIKQVDPQGILFINTMLNVVSYDAVRPVSAIRYLYPDKMVTTWSEYFASLVEGTARPPSVANALQPDLLLHTTKWVHRYAGVIIVTPRVVPVYKATVTLLGCASNPIDATWYAYQTCSTREDPLELCSEVVFKAYQSAVSAGIEPEDARLLPHSALVTKMRVTITCSALLHMSDVRLCTPTHWEFRNIVGLMRVAIQKQEPELASYLAPKMRRPSLALLQ